MSDKPVTLAAIIGAHGVTGEVRLKLFGDGLDSLKAHKAFNEGTLTLTKIRSDNKGGAIARFAEAADRIIADIKLIDPARHLRETGVDNALILRNIRHLSQKGTHLLLRVPLIPGFTDDEENIRGIAQFVASLGREIPVELLNFNPMCREKYESLRQRYAFDPNQREIAQERVDALKQILTDHGLRTL